MPIATTASTQVQVVSHITAAAPITSKELSMSLQTEIGTLDVEALCLSAPQHAHRHEIDDKTSAGDSQHRQGLNLRRHNEPLVAFIEDVCRNREQHGGIEGSCEDLSYRQFLVTA
jgi:hypothetical protein